MDLVLWRHADAEDGVRDAERRLTDKGVKQAERMARWLEKRLPADAIVLTSPALRAQQTAKALSPGAKSVEELYHGDARAVLAAAGWPKRDGTVIVVGHQPVLGQALALALTGKAAEWNIKKGAIAWLAWRARGDGPDAQLRALISPDLL